MDVKYRGFGISVEESRGRWAFHAHPSSAELPILARAEYTYFPTKNAALDAARAEIDRVLTI
jgi:hypothetical protein